MRDVRSFIELAKNCGLRFAVRYKTGKAREGIDFITVGGNEMTTCTMPWNKCDDCPRYCDDCDGCEEFCEEEKKNAEM